MGMAGACKSFMLSIQCFLRNFVFIHSTKFFCIFQTCTEMVFPMGYGENETMFQSDPFDINNYTKECVDAFGIKPRPHWITAEFGGHVSFSFRNSEHKPIFYLSNKLICHCSKNLFRT